MFSYCLKLIEFIVHRKEKWIVSPRLSRVNKPQTPWRRELSPHNARRQRRCARDALPYTSNIGWLQSVENYHNNTYLQWIYKNNWKINWRLYCWFWHRWLLEFPANSASYWHREHGDTHSTSFHTTFFWCRAYVVQLRHGHVIIPY